MTPQRVAVLQALHDGSHHSPLDVFFLVRQTGMTETTVYRTLEFLRENGIITCTYDKGGHIIYEMPGSLHHHLVCRHCGARMEVGLSFLTDLSARLEAESGFHLVGEHQTLFGLCPECKGNEGV
jgi:Fur family ferric uptake transcriptional regulator